MKHKPLFFDPEDDSAVDMLPEEPQDGYGNPLIVPPEIWKNTVINFENLIRPERRAFSRVPCRGKVVLLTRKGKIVAKGALKDLNEKSSGLEIKAYDLRVNDVFFLEFMDPVHLVLSQVKVILKRVQLMGHKLRIGVEFIDTTAAFQDKLDTLLAHKRNVAGFKDNEII